MKKSIKISLIIIPLALLACLVAFVVFVVLRSPDEPVDVRVSNTSGGPAFEVQVVVPRGGLPLGGILPDALVKKLDGTPRELRFNHASPGARIVNAGPDRLELSAEGGWNLFIEADGEGRITSGTHLVFPLGLGGNRVRLDCRPAGPGFGHLYTTTGSDDEIGGSFLVKLATCKNAESGKTTDWPPAPLTVRGSFVGPSQHR